MEQSAAQNNGRGRGARARKRGGFTLIEVMVALIVLAVGMLASVMGIMAALNQGVIDEMRGDAMKIGQVDLEMARNMPYATMLTYQFPSPVYRQVGKNMNVAYTVQVNATQPPDASGNAAQDAEVQVTVTWRYKPPLASVFHTYYYVAQTIVRQYP